MYIITSVIHQFSGSITLRWPWRLLKQMKRQLLEGPWFVCNTAACPYYPHWDYFSRLYMPPILRQTMTNQDIVLSYWFRLHHIPVISCDILISSLATAITHCWSFWIVKIQQLDFPLLQPPIFGSGRLHTSPPGWNPGPWAAGCGWRVAHNLEMPEKQDIIQVSVKAES